MCCWSIAHRQQIRVDDEKNWRGRNLKEFGAGILRRFHTGKIFFREASFGDEGNWKVERYRQCQIAAVQAYGMHEFHPLHRDRHIGEKAFRHVRET